MMTSTSYFSLKNGLVNSRNGDNMYGCQSYMSLYDIFTIFDQSRKKENRRKKIYLEKYL